MPRLTKWRELRVGVAALAIVSAALFGILVFGRLGRIPGETYRVYVRAPEARGIIPGSEVWMLGQKVGAVREIAFLPPSAGTNRVLMEVELSARHREALRRNSPVEIRPGASLIGAPVVYLGFGSPDAPVIDAGDTLVTHEQIDLAALGDRAGGAMKAVPGILADVRSLAALAKSPDGTLGAFMHARGGSELAEARTRMSAISGRLRNQQGTLGLALGRRGELVARTRLAMSRADSIRALLGSDATSLGRFRRDSTLVREIAEVRDELSILRALLNDPDGTLGRLKLDSAIVAGVAEVEREMSALFADVKQRPFRYLAF